MANTTGKGSLVLTTNAQQLARRLPSAVVAGSMEDITAMQHERATRPGDVAEIMKAQLDATKHQEETSRQYLPLILEELRKQAAKKQEPPTIMP